MSLQLVAHSCTLIVLGRIKVKALGACVLQSELILFRQCATNFCGKREIVFVFDLEEMKLNSE